MDNIHIDRIAVIIGTVLRNRQMIDLVVTETICSSDDSEDDEMLGERLVPVRIKYYIGRTIPNYTARQFQSHFRVTRPAYETLLGLVGHMLTREDGVGRCNIDANKQLLSVIWLLSNQESYRSVGEMFDMGKSSIFVSFTRVIKALVAIAPNVITWPTGIYAQRVKENFERKAGVPNVIGAIDGTYIPIKAPLQDPEVYITRKCQYALTMQAICDSDLHFTDIYVGWPGSVSDTRIFRNSTIYRNISRNRVAYLRPNEFIIGDKAYPPLDWCVPPYINRGNLRAQQLHFNRIISQTRQTIERTFALFFGRFRRMKFLDMNRFDLIPDTILAACTLHNICLRHEDLHIEEYVRDGMAQAGVIQDIGIDVHVPLLEENGLAFRDQLCQQLYIDHH